MIINQFEHFFHILIGYKYFLFCEMLISIAQFSTGLFLFCYQFVKFCYTLWILSQRGLYVFVNYVLVLLSFILWYILGNRCS